MKSVFYCTLVLCFMLIAVIGCDQGMNMMEPAVQDTMDTQPPFYIYWTGWFGGIQRAANDGSNLQNLVTDTGFYLFDIALDVEGGKMYWTLGDNAGEIRRANLDGSNAEVLITASSRLRGIALNVAGGKMYWTSDSGVHRSNLDGSNVEDLVGGLISPRGIALDVAAGKMYWTGDKVWRANLDGSNVEDLQVPDVQVEGPEAPLDSKSGIALDVAAGKMYWVDLGDIRRANLDGSNVEDLIETRSGSVYIALDVEGGKMYWTEIDKVRRANLDGSNVQDLVTGLRSPSGIALGIPQMNMMKPAVQDTVDTQREDEPDADVEQDNGTMDTTVADPDVQPPAEPDVEESEEPDDTVAETPEEPEDTYTPLAGLIVSNGRVQLGFISAGGCIRLNSSLNGVRYNTHSSKWQRRDGTASPWSDIPGTEEAGGLCSYSPKDPGQYRLVGEVSINGVRGKYASENILTVE